MSIEIVLVIAATAAGALVHGCLGIGMGLVAGPVLIGVDSGFAPGPLLVAGQIVGLRHILMERQSLDQATLRRCLLGLPPGVAAALLVLSLVSDRVLALLIGGFTAAAAIAILTGRQVARRPSVDVVTGSAVAFAGVTAGLPGPPVVVAFHDMSPTVMRSTASAYMLTVAVVGVTGLALTGGFGAREVGLTAGMLPGIALGLVAARWLRPVLDRSWFRTVVLLAAAAGGLGLMIRQL